MVKRQTDVRKTWKGAQKAGFGIEPYMGLVDGYAFIDKPGWNACNEGTYLPYSVGCFRRRMGNYPAGVLANKIYGNRENRKWLKERGTCLAAKPLGRPLAQAVDNHVIPGHTQKPRVRPENFLNRNN